MSDSEHNPVSDEEITNESIVEAVLFASDAPLPAARVAQLLGSGTAVDVKKHVERLNQRYAEQGASFRIETVANGRQMLTLPLYHRWIEKLSKARSDSS